MGSEQLDSVTQTLREQETRLLEAIENQKEVLAGFQADLERVQGALAALDPTSNKTRKKRKSPKKPSASKADVESALMAAKDEFPEADDAKHRAVAEQKIVEQGFSKVGLALRFSQVLGQAESEAVESSSEFPSASPL